MLGIGNIVTAGSKVANVVRKGLQAWYKADNTQAPLGEERLDNGNFNTGPNLLPSISSLSSWGNNDAVQVSDGIKLFGGDTYNHTYISFGEANWGNYFHSKTYLVRATVTGGPGSTGKKFRIQDNSDNNGGLVLSDTQTTMTEGVTQSVEFYWTTNTSSNTLMLSRHNSTGSDYEFTVNSLTLNETNPNDSWTTAASSGGVVTVKDGKVEIVTNGAAAELKQTGVFTVGKKYQVTVDATINSGAGVKVGDGSDDDLIINNISSTGVYTAEFTATHADFEIAREGSSDSSSTINSVSIKEITNSVKDFSPNSNDAILYSGTALDFDGANDYATLDHPAGGTTVDSNFKCTIALWFNADTLGQKMIFSTAQQNDNRFYLWTNLNKLQFDFGTNSSTTPTTGTMPSVVANRWYRVVVAIDGLTAYVYLDGELQYTKTSGAFNIATLSSNLTLGRHGSTSTHYYDGMISDFQTYDACWTDLDVEFDYNNPDKDVFDDKDRVAVVVDSELHTNANPASVTNESSNIETSSNGVPSWTHNHITSDSSVTNNSNFSIKFQAQAAGNRSYIDLNEILTIGKQYKLQIDVRHVGSGDDFILQFNKLNSLNTGSDQKAIATITSSDTNFATYTQIFTHNDSTRFFGVKENGNNDNAGGYLDNLTIKEYQSAGIQPTGCKTLLRLNEGAGDRLYDAAPVLGDNLLAGNNSTFNGANNWSNYTESGSNGTASVSTGGGILTVTLSGATEKNGSSNNNLDSGAQISNTYNTQTVGSLYFVSADVWLGTATATDFKIWMGGNVVKSINPTTNRTTFSGYVKTTNTGSLKIYENKTNGDSGTFFIDNVSVKEITSSDSFLYVDGDDDTTEWKTAQPYIPQLAMSSYSKKAIFGGAGSGDYIDCGKEDSVDNLFDGGGSWSVWVSGVTDGGANVGTVISKLQPRIRTTQDSGDDLTLEFMHEFSTTNGVWSCPATALLENKLNHVVVTYNNSNVSNNPTIYINGIAHVVGGTPALSEGGTPEGARDSDASDNFVIGNVLADTTNNNFDGFIDEVAIFDKILTEAEVQEIYNAGTALDCRDHSAYLGSELVTDTDLNDSTYWTREDTYTAGTFVFSDNGLNIDSSKNVTGTDDNTEYIHRSSFGTSQYDVVSITFTITNYVSGQFRAYIGSSTGSTVVSGNGTYTFTDTADTSQVLYLQSKDNFIGTISSISVKKVDLKGYWRNSGADTWTDLSAYGNNGTVNGSPITIQLQEVPLFNKDSLGLPMNKVRQKGLNLDADSYAIIEPAPKRSNVSAITVEAWVYLRDGGGSSQGIVGQKGATNYLLFRSGTNHNISLYINGGLPGDNVGAQTSVLALNTWHHIVATYDKSLTNECNIYVNGVSNNQRNNPDADGFSNPPNGAINADVNTNETAMYLGEYGTNANYFSGIIDDAKIYDRALSLSEVKRNYNASKSQHRTTSSNWSDDFNENFV